MESLVEAILLGALLIPPLRLYALCSFRRRINSLPRTHFLVLSFIALCLICLFVLAIFLPLILRLVFIAACLISLYLLWRARPSYGRSRGLPPGSLALFPYGQWSAHDYYQKNFSRYGPIFKSSDLYRPSVNIVGIERIREFLVQQDDGLGFPGAPFNRFIPNGFLRYTSPARHETARPIFQTVLTSGVTRAAEPLVAGTIRAELWKMAADSQASPDGINPEAYMLHIADYSLSRLFFGIGPESEIYSQWQAMLHIIAIRRSSRVTDVQVRDTLAKIMTLLSNLFSQEPPARTFVSEMERAHPGALRDSFFMLNLVYMFLIGRNDMTGLLLWLVKMLSDHPSWAARLRAQDAPADLAARIVMETLRLHQSEYLLRLATRDLHFQNFIIPKGWFIRLCVMESHHLAASVDAPEVFNPDRFLAPEYDHSEFMPFGTFQKSCLGEVPTLSISKTLIRELARNYEWQTLCDGPTEFSGFHWQPSTQFRIVCTQIDL